MNPYVLLGIITENNLRVTPVLQRNGQLRCWMVGETHVSPTSGLNYVHTQAWGETLEVAVAKWHEGRCYLRDNQEVPEEIPPPPR